MEKEIKIIPPDGYKVDEENSTFECIKFKPIKNTLPTTWEEFCNTHPIKVGEAYMDTISSINVIEVGLETKRLSNADRNTLPSKQYAEAIRALCQLIQLRDCYNDGWQPDWTDIYSDKWCIEVFKGQIDKTTHSVAAYILAFKSAILRDKFLENFKDLIEIAKPLL